jgi:hypothetical protein
MTTESPLVWFAVWVSIILVSLSFGALGAAMLLWSTADHWCLA